MTNHKEVCSIGSGVWVGDEELAIDTGVKVVERTSQGAVGGVPVTLHITDTYHPDGRKDCCVRVPRLRTKGKLEAIQCQK